MNILERFTAMVSDLTKNGFSGAGGFAIIVAGLLVVLVFAIFGAIMRDNGNNDND